MDDLDFSVVRKAIHRLWSGVHSCCGRPKTSVRLVVGNVRIVCDSAAVPGPLDDVKLHLVHTLDWAMDFKRWLGERHENNCISVDTETTGLDPRAPGARIRLIQFGDTQQGWALPWEDWRGLALEALNGWDGIFGTHNLAFEAKWLGVHSDFKFPRDRTIDTMLGAHILNPLGTGRLKDLSVQQVDRRAAAGQSQLNDDFAEHGWDWGTVPVRHGAYWKYAALDAILTSMLWGKVRPALTTTYKRVFDMEMAVRFIVSKMEMHGALVDLEYSQAKWDSLSAHADKIQAWGKEAFKINIGSNVRLAELLVAEDETIGKLAEQTTGGQMQVDKELLLLLANPENEFSERLQTIAKQTLIMRKARKYASSYFESFCTKNYDGSVHADIRTLGARTGRMSISNPAMQQCPKDSALVRNAFIPADGNCIVTCDFSQVEMRIMAELSRDAYLQQAFLTADQTGGDFFVEIGRQVYADPGFTKKDKRRTLIKSTMYGKAYGAGPETMAATAGVKVDKMKEVVNTLDLNYPGINAFMHQVETVGRAREASEGQGYVTTKVGRRLPCDTGRLYTLTNYLIQSTAADVLKEALIRLDAAGYDEFMILPVHDEVLFDIPWQYADQALRDVPLLMQELGHPVPLLAESDGPYTRWGERYA